MRSILFLVGVLVAALLLVALGFFISQKYERTESEIGRYQLQRGHRIVPNTDGFETMFLVDTSSGKTWELGQIGASSVLEWHLISARPEQVEESQEKIPLFPKK
jgi:hypothetical protein